jgi:multidrug efflux pump subunit AcrB
VVGEYVAAAGSPPTCIPAAPDQRQHPAGVHHRDREKVKSLGVSLTDVFQTLQTMLGHVHQRL